MALDEILGKDAPSNPDFNGLFTVDDFTRGKALEQADSILWELVPTDLPERPEADRLLNYFFLFTERTFPILHRPSFENVVDELYALDPITTESFEQLSQFYFCLSVGHCFDMSRSREDRIRDQIRNLEIGCRCHFTTLHTRRDGLTRIQTLALQAYALIMLRQRSEALRVSAMANMKALECGLHHDGTQHSGNPLKTEMRRRVFWCVFMLHLFGASFLGLPRALHEADITVSEPSDIDDEFLTSTRVLGSVPGRTKMHRFVNVCRLIRILSRTVDVLYTHNKRKHASTRIEQMNRLCCEHLLDQLDFSFQEVPDDLPEADTQDPLQMAILISHANEQLLYHYIRWLIHRPGLALGRSEAQFASCLQTCTEAASAMLELLDLYAPLLPFIKSSPVAHHMTIFVAALTPLYRTHLLRCQPMTIPAPTAFMEDDMRAAQHGINAIRNEPYDKNDLFRGDLLASMVAKVFGQHEAGHQGESTSSVGMSGAAGRPKSFSMPHALLPSTANNSHPPPQVQIRPPSSDRSIPTEASISIGPPTPLSPHNLQQQHHQQPRSNSTSSMNNHNHNRTQFTHPPPQGGPTPMDWSEHRIAHLTAQEDLRDLVHEVFSPAMDPWTGVESNQYPG
ncbi:hypothetical protein PRZ48_001795 [Zasmidium cellare]|uniref:Xylanolytic transcriptional activator regulatory domain-containing protein n=1 Tax=Zasmidium cellare TaxID=395010 RepID=A0ABR0F4P4_ZASCE|nr:hypothetical protein PRZ48_001795 [Zasmidium cellare]